jgi:proline iminopeptidase
MRIAMNGTELYVDVDGAQLVEGEDGLAERRTVVVLHGGPGFDQGYLRPGLGPLRADAQLVFVDLRGQGRSGRPPVETCTLEQMADDVAGLCGVLGIERPVVFGHSAGGFVALHVALRHPDLVAGLVLCDSAPTLAPLPDDFPPAGLGERAPAEALDVAARLFAGDFSERSLGDFAQWVAPYYAGPTHMDVPGRLLQLGAFASDVAAHFFTVLAPRYDVRPRLGELEIPALVVVGEHDWVCPPVASRALAEGLRDAELVRVADAGHFPFSEEPAAFLETVRGYLRQIGEPVPDRAAARSVAR